MTPWGLGALFHALSEGKHLAQTLKTSGVSDKMVFCVHVKGLQSMLKMYPTGGCHFLFMLDEVLLHNKSRPKKALRISFPSPYCVQCNNTMLLLYHFPGLLSHLNIFKLLCYSDMTCWLEVNTPASILLHSFSVFWTVNSFLSTDAFPGLHLSHPDNR